MHMSLSSILGTDLHMIKPLQALDPMCVWNEVMMKLEGFYILTGSCCSLHCVLLVSEHENGRAHSVHMPTSLLIPCSSLPGQLVLVNDCYAFVSNWTTGLTRKLGFGKAVMWFLGEIKYRSSMF